MNRMFSIALGVALALGACGGKSKHDSTGPEVGTGDVMQPELPPETPPAADPVFPDEPFRHAQPQAGDPRPFQLPMVKTFKVGELDVYLVEDHKLPKVSLELNLEGGQVTDPKGKEGLAGTCMEMMSEGTAKQDKIAFREALADVASNVGSYAGLDTQGVTMSTLTKHFDATFALFSDTITQPGFRKEELDRMIKRSLESLKQAKASPSSVAGRVRDSVLYGERHPYGAIRTEKSLGKISIADCKAYHKAYVKPKGGRLFVVGDMTEDEVKAKVAPLLATWKGAPKKIAKLPAPKPRPGRLFFVDIPNSAQSMIYVMHMGPGRKDPAFFSNQMMAMILGGGFSSRINMNLREDKGYSYGARGGFNYSRNYGTFTASSSVRADATRQSVLEILKEMRGIHSGDASATETELLREKNGAVLGLPSRFNTSSATLASYTDLIYHGLPLDYYSSYAQNVGAVTLEQVAAAAKAQIKLGDAIILVVGDGASPQVTRDDHGKDIELLDAEGKQITLRAALSELASAGDLGKGGFVVLDADGKSLK